MYSNFRNYATDQFLLLICNAYFRQQSSADSELGDAWKLMYSHMVSLRPWRAIIQKNDLCDSWKGSSVLLPPWFIMHESVLRVDRIFQVNQTCNTTQLILITVTFGFSEGVSSYLLIFEGVSLISVITLIKLSSSSNSKYFVHCSYAMTN